jgi:hypothetical protein
MHIPKISLNTLLIVVQGLSMGIPAPKLAYLAGF